MKLANLVMATLSMLGTIGCAATLPANSSTPNLVSDPDVEAMLVDQTWISPAEVKVGNYHPGAQAEWSIRIHNGKDTAATFLVSYKQPDSVTDSYTSAPAEAADWVIIVDNTPILAPKETKEVSVVLAMPKEATVSSQKWEFWVSVVEQEQGTIQVEMCERWLVSMRK